MRNTNITTIIFDLDETLTPEGFTTWNNMTMKLGLPIEKHHAILKKFKNKELTVDEAIQAIVDLWNSSKSFSKKKFLEIANSTDLRPDAERVINYLKPNYNLCIISGTLEPMVEVVANRLGIDEYFGLSKVTWEKDKKIKWFTYSNDNQANLKANVLENYMSKNNLKFDEIAAIGDGSNDLEIFDKVNTSICIRNSKNKDIQKHTDYAINNLEDLLDIL